ncbi:BAG family molecular chaperone regulator 6-like [Neltuma alba]|uniref:BAG family molecular chaperone regulator 6-like n=1 Tax=Neltuma alba TaxID=207710 RepID=UPI0010A30D31|nr:BAG family molecular chaperone regulator 6-like [Prosopis alba]
MSTPYFGSYRSMPSSSPHSKPRVRGIPVATPKRKASPKVVSIPVHFVGSERSRSDSALKIQKVLRGFLVRKNLKKIAAISNEVNQIERKISDHETIDLIRRNSCERLRINETLMNLLLRLDSVTSVDFGVRGCRKSVIKKAIALQEKLDLIAAAVDSHAQGQGRVEVAAYTSAVSQEVNSDLHDNAGDFDRAEGISEFQSPVKEDDEIMADDSASELPNNVEAMPVSVPSEGLPDFEVIPENPGQEASTLTINPPLESETKTEAKENGLKETSKDQLLYNDRAGTCLAGEQPGTCAIAETASVKEDKEINSSLEVDGRNMVARESEAAVRDNGRKEEQNRDRELLQRMIEDNERMMGLMAELFKRDEIQTRILSSLSERVKKLEKAYAWEKLRKKKRNAASATDGSDILPDIKKCDKKQ